VAEPAPGLWSNCLRVGDTVYTAGLTARDGALQATGGAEYEQSWATLRRMAALLAAAGGSLRDVVKPTIYMTDISQREAFRRARREPGRGASPHL